MRKTIESTLAFTVATLVVASAVTGAIAIPAVAAGATDVSIAPQQPTLSTGEKVTVNVVVENADNGVGAWSGTVNVTSGDVADITAANLQGNPSDAVSTVDIASDNNSVYFDAALADTNDTGAVDIVSITLTATGEGETALDLSMSALGDEQGSSYTIDTVADGSLTAGAVFEYNNLSLNTTSGTAPITISASTTVENVGGEAGEQTVPLLVAEERVDSKNVSLDAGESKTVDFEYTFNNPGTYKVAIGSLSAKTVAVNGQPTAALNASTTKVNVDDSITFNASESTDPDGDQLSYAWDLDGDGTYDDGSGPTASRSFSEPGTYDISVNVSDGTATDTQTVSVTVVDETSPSPSIIVDTDGEGTSESTAELGRTIVLDGTNTTDNVDTESYEWVIHSSTSGDILATLNGSTAQYTPTNPGEYEITLTVTDTSENKASTNTSIEVVDTTPPAVRLAHLDAAIVNTTTTFDASNSTDNGSIDEYRWDLDGDGAIDKTTTDPTADYEYTEANQTVTVTVTAVDQSNNTNTTSETFETSRAPAIEIVSPEKGSVTNDSTVSIQYRTDNLDAGTPDDLEYRVDGGDWSATESLVDATVDLGSLDEGDHTVTFRLVGSDGNRYLPGVSSTTDSVTIIVDRTSPSITLSSPNNRSVDYGTPVNVSVTDENLADVQYKVEYANGTTSTLAALAEPYTISTADFPEGVTTFTVIATDEAGISQSKDFTFDFISPPDIESLQPNRTRINTTSPTITATYSDDDVAGDQGINASNIQLTVDGETVKIDSENRSVNSLSTVVTLSPEDLDKSTHTVSLTVVDEAGHATTRTATFPVDAKAPTIALSANKQEHVSTNNPTELAFDSTDSHPDQTVLTISKNGTIVSTYNVTGRVASESSSLTWNATNASGNPVANGVYNVTLSSIDTFENRNTTTVTVTVDNEKPTVAVQEATAGSGVVTPSSKQPLHANETVTVNVSASGTPGNVSSVAVSMNAEFTNYEKSVPATYQNGNWVAALDVSKLPDEGAYSVSANATDLADNTNETASGIVIDVDRTSPTLGATISRENTTTAQVNVTASEDVDPESLNLTVTLPDDTTRSVAVNPDGDRYTGTFALADNGSQYNIDVTGTDLAGNHAHDTASAVIQEVNTENQTVTVKSETTGVFVRFNTSSEVQSSFVSLTASDAPLNPLTSDLVGASFLNGELGQKLTDNLDNATIGIPVNESTLPAGVSPENVTIRRYNSTQNSWVEFDTSVETVTLADGTTGTYWVATVDHFSTYGAVAEDNTAPYLSEAGPSGDLQYGETATTVRFEYGDNLTSVNASSVELQFDGKSVTDAAETSISSQSATYDATGLTPGETYTGTVHVVDQAGNAENYTTEFTVIKDITPPNFNSVSPVDGSNLAASTDTVTVTADYGDDFSGVDTDKVSVYFNDSDVTSEATIGTSSLSYDASTLQSGTSYDVRVVLEDKVGNTIAKTFSFTIDTSTTSTGGGGGGGGGGQGSAEAISHRIFDMGDYTTVRIKDIPRSSETQIDTSGKIVGTAGSVTSLDLDFRFDPANFRIEATHPHATETTPSLPANAADPVMYFDVEFFGVSPSKVKETNIGIQVNSAAMPNDATLADLTAYQYVDGEWIELDTRQDGDELIITAETNTASQYAIGYDTQDAKETTTTISPTRTVTETPTTTQSTATPTTDTSVSTTGFGVIVSLLSMLVIVLWVSRRQNSE